MSRSTLVMMMIVIIVSRQSNVVRVRSEGKVEPVEYGMVWIEWNRNERKTKTKSKRKTQLVSEDHSSKEGNEQHSLTVERVDWSSSVMILIPVPGLLVRTQYHTSRTKARKATHLKKGSKASCNEENYSDSDGSEDRGESK